MVSRGRPKKPRDKDFKLSSIKIAGEDLEDLELFEYMKYYTSMSEGGRDALRRGIEEIKEKKGLTPAKREKKLIEMREAKKLKKQEQEAI